ncbi:MAG: amino acid racemase [Nanoarchaeota archaeon]
MKNKIKNKTIGILGGMGPQASSYLYDLIIKKSIKDYGVIDNKDFPDIVLFSISIPDFIGNSKNKPNALRVLKQKVEDANKIGLSCLSMACNTAHILLPDIQKNMKMPFISLIDEVARETNDLNIKKVGLLGTPTTLKSNLYQKALAKYKIKAVTPSKNQFSSIESVIRRVISGKQNEKDQQTLQIIAHGLKKEGAQGIILGCTELPLAFPKKIDLPVLNSVEVLADALLRHYYAA